MKTALKTPKISIIIPVYNIENYLARCIDSVLKQSYENIEVILVNDGSTDKSGALIDQYAQHDKRIKVIHQANGGVSKARNAGIDVTDGDFLMFVDGDDRIDQETYAKCIALMEEQDDLVSFSVARIDASEKGGVKEGDVNGAVETLKGRSSVMARYLQKDDLRVVAQLFRRKVLGAQRFDVTMRIHEDAMFMLTYLEKVKSASILSMPMYFYISRSGSAMKRVVESDTHDIRKHYDKIVYDVAKKYPGLELEVLKHSVPVLFNMLTVARQAGLRDEVLRVRQDISKTRKSIGGRYVLPLRYHVKLALSYVPVPVFDYILAIYRKFRKVI